MAEFYFTETSGPFKLFYAPECDSTSALIRNLLPSYAGTGPLAMYSFHQKKGRGQGKNTWLSNPGENLAITLALDISEFGGNPIMVNKCISLAVKNAIQKLSGIDAFIKWPNDIILNNKKCSGLLMETVKEGQHTFFVAGVGINVNQKNWPAHFGATSISEITGKELHLINVVVDVMSAIDLTLKRIEFNENSLLNEEFDLSLWQRDVWAKLEIENMVLEGKITKVDSEGRLVFLDRKGLEHRMHHGQVRMSKNNPAFFQDGSNHL